MLVLYKKYGVVLMDIHFNRLTAKYKKETIDTKQNGIKDFVVNISDGNKDGIRMNSYRRRSS